MQVNSYQQLQLTLDLGEEDLPQVLLHIEKLGIFQ
jgi:hypothetical protein